MPVMPGVAFFPRPEEPLWQQRLDVSLARCEGAWRRSPRAIALRAQSAALVQGLWLQDREPDVHVLVRSAPHPSAVVLPQAVFTDPLSGARVPGRARVCLRRRRGTLPEEDLIVVGNVVTTSPMRTAIDCAFDMPARESLPIVDAAMRVLVEPDRSRPEQTQARWRQVRAELLRRVEAEGRRNGAVRARAVAAIASPYSESPGESVLRWQVHALGLPEPVLQHRVVVDETGRSYFLDLAWPALRIAFEYDGRAKYDALVSAWDEKRRQDEITGAGGWWFRRFTSEDLRVPGALERAVLSAFPLEVVRACRPVAALYA